MTSGADQIIALYEQHARDYERERGTRLVIEKAWMDRFAALLPRGASILDIGCGSGQPIAGYLIEQGFQISGIDTSPTLIARCRERFPDRQWHVADMRNLALGRTFQGLLAWDSFFHLSFADQRRMFPVFRRHAEPGTVLMFTSGPAHGEAIGTYHDQPLYHASLAESEHRSLLAANGFVVNAYVPEDPTCGAHTVWLAQLGR